MRSGRGWARLGGWGRKRSAMRNREDWAHAYDSDHICEGGGV